MTFQVRLGCENCGRVEIYEIPQRHEITDYVKGASVYSQYERRNGTGNTMLFCAFCAMPYLKVLWWDETQVEVHTNNETVN